MRSALDRLARKFAAGDVLEFWKSTPCTLNFIEGYKLTPSLKQASSSGISQKELTSLVAGVTSGISEPGFR